MKQCLELGFRRKEYVLDTVKILSIISGLGSIFDRATRSVSSKKHFSRRLCKCIADIVSEFRSLDLGGTGLDWNENIETILSQKNK